MERQPKLEVGNSTFYHSNEVVHTDEELEELKSQEFIFGSEEPFIEEAKSLNESEQLTTDDTGKFFIVIKIYSKYQIVNMK